MCIPVYITLLCLTCRELYYPYRPLPKPGNDIIKWTLVHLQNISKDRCMFTGAIESPPSKGKTESFSCLRPNGSTAKSLASLVLARAISQYFHEIVNTHFESAYVNPSTSQGRLKQGGTSSRSVRTNHRALLDCPPLPLIHWIILGGKISNLPSRILQ